MERVAFDDGVLSLLDHDAKEGGTISYHAPNKFRWRMFAFTGRTLALKMIKKRSASSRKCLGEAAACDIQPTLVV